jgi:UDP-2-acetamido-2,6-beta-L-arabino-hexul-4-ose reductase
MIVGITGANGFVGRNLCQYFQDAGITYRIFDGDVEKWNDLWSFVDAVDFVVHLARKNKGAKYPLLQTNVIGTYNLAVICAEKGKRSVCINSDYSHKGPYKAGNEIGERIVLSVNENMNGQNSLLVLPRLYGPWCRPHYNSFVSTILYSIAKKEPYEHLIDDLETELALLHVDDVCLEIGKLAQSPAYYNYSRLVPTEKYKIKDIIELAEGSDNIFAELVEWYQKNM